MLGDPTRKRPVSIAELLLIVGLFAIDFGAWISFPEFTFLAFLGLMLLLVGIAALYIPSPWDVMLASIFGVLTLGVVAGLIVSP